MKILSIDKQKLFRIIVTILMVSGLLFPTGGIVHADDPTPAAEPESQSESGLVNNEAPADDEKTENILPSGELEPQRENDVDLADSEVPSDLEKAEDILPPGELEPQSENDGELIESEVSADIVDDEPAPVVLDEIDLAIETDVPSDGAIDEEKSGSVELEKQFSQDQSEITQVVEMLNEQGKSLLNAEGKPIFMGSIEAEEVLLNQDPFFWNGTNWVGYTVSGTGCPINVVCLADSSPFQAAVSAAPANSTIYVASGTYEEDVVVNTPNLSFTAFNSITVPNTSANLVPDAPGFALLKSLTLNVDFGTTSGVYASHVIVNEPGKTGGRVADALNLVDRSDDEATIEANMKIVSSSLDAKGSGDNYYRVQDANDASTHFEWDCSEPQITINVNQSYRMTLMNPNNPLIANYFTVERGSAVSPRSPDITLDEAQALVEDLVLAANMSEQTVGGFVPWRNMDEKLIYWNLLGHVGKDSSGNSIALNTIDPDGTGPKQNQQAIYDYIKSGLNDNTIDNYMDVWFLWPKSLGNTAKSPFDTQLTFLKLVGPTISGCTDPEALNYDPNADGQGICDYPEIPDSPEEPEIPGEPAPPTTINAGFAGLIPVTGGRPIIVAGLSHTCMTVGNEVACWGLNDSGQVGNGNFTQQIIPNYVLDLQNVIDLTAGSLHTCALTADGEVWCWGENGSGQLGNNSTEDSNRPVLVDGLPGKVIDFTAGNNFTCAQLENTEIWCWGDNQSGQLNDGTLNNRQKPVKSLLAGNLSLISGGQKVLASESTGEVSTWKNVELQLVNNVSMPQDISANRWATGGCVSTLGGIVKCWQDDHTSTQVQGVNSSILVETGYKHSCSINGDLSLSCWGNNITGQLGNGTAENSEVAVNVSNLDTIQDLALGEYHTCVLAGDDYSAFCWGSNSNGQLGNNTLTDESIPVKVHAPIRSLDS